MLFRSSLKIYYIYYFNFHFQKLILFLLLFCFDMKKKLVIFTNLYNSQISKFLVNLTILHKINLSQIKTTLHIIYMFKYVKFYIIKILNIYLIIFCMAYKTCETSTFFFISYSFKLDQVMVRRETTTYTIHKLRLTYTYSHLFSKEMKVIRKPHFFNSEILLNLL